MDLGGIPDGNDVSGDDGVTDDVHHDPLNENFEETWSALGEQDARSSAGSDPGMLPPPIPVLPTSLGSIIGQPFEHQGMSQLSVLRAPKQTIRAANINQGSSEGIFADLMAGRWKLKPLVEDNGNPKTSPISTGFRMFGRKGSVDEEVVVPGSSISKKRIPWRSTKYDTETLQSQSKHSKEEASSDGKDDNFLLDLFFKTMYNKTKKLPLMKQIELRREIRQLVMNAEKPSQDANRQKSAEATDESSSIISINASREKSELQLSDDNRVRDPSKLRLELEFTASNHMQIALVTSASHDHHKAFYKDDVKSKAILSSKSSPSLYRSCSITSKPSSVIGNGSLFCRICHEGGSSEQFISPCCCRGSLSRVHKTCLERWLAESDSSHCELCGYKYRTKRVPKYGLMSSIFAWLTSNSTSRERRNLLIDILALLIISPIIGLSTILALQLADSLFILESMEKMEQTEIRVLPRRGIEPDFSNKSHTTLEVVGTMISRLGQMGIISMVITMDMAYISWVAMRLQAHVTKWYTWYRRNCKVTLIGYPDQVIVQPSLQRSSSISVHQISF